MTTATDAAPAGEKKVEGAAAAAEAAKTVDPAATATTDTKATDAAVTDDKATDAGKTGDTQQVATDDDDGSVLDIDLDDDAGDTTKAADGKAAEGDKAADADKDKTAAPASNAWAKERDAAADRFIKKIEKKLSVDKDGKPLSARQKTAAVDDAREKFLAKLARYPSLTEALLAGVVAQDKISSGKFKAPLPDDATDEELANWRKENGIPEDAKGYKLPKVQGQEWTEADKPGLDKFFSKMHEKNASQAQIDTALSTYKELIEEAKATHAENLKATDKADTQATQEVLRTEYEGEFKPAMTLLKRLVEDAEVFPDDAGKLIAQARTADGHRLINNLAIAKFLIEYARDRYGEGAMTTGDQQAVMNSEEQELNNLMNTDIDAYNYKPWKSTGMTASERHLEVMRKKEASGRGRRAA